MDHFLRVETPSAVYAVAFVGTRIVYGSSYGMAVARRLGTSDVRVFRRHVERQGAKTMVLRGDGPCMLEDDEGRRT